MESVGDSRSTIGRHNARYRVRGRCAPIAIAFVLTGLLLAAPAAAAPPILGTPDPVAPGVPGYGRAWELVTPPAITPARIYAGFGGNPIRKISPSGDRLAYESINALEGASYGGVFTVNVGQRGAGGWASAPFEFPYPETATGVGLLLGYEGLFAFDPEITMLISGATLPPPSSGLALFASRIDGTSTQLVVMDDQVPPGEGQEGDGEFRFASEDAQRVFFRTKAHLLPADAARTEGASLYESFDSTLRLVDVNDDGTLVSACGSLYGGGVSTDGQRVFFTAKPECGPKLRAYLRAGGHTTEISASQCTLPDPECGPAADVEIYRVTPSGSAALLVTAERLTNDDANAELDLYRYDTASGDLSLLSLRAPGATVPSPDFRLRASDDGSRVYFSVIGQLLPGQGTAEEYKRNLYLADSQGLHFIASPSDSEQSFEASEDGRYVLFETPSQLGVGDTDAKVDLYRYDSVADSYTQVSTGLEGRGNGAFDAHLITSVPSGPDIGQRIFFRTAEQLLPQDHNEADDVYEWTQAGGLGLLSAGTPGFSGEYLGGTADGSTVFVRTGATLGTLDRDGGELDIYAARVGGGFAEPVAEAVCQGAACEEAAKPSPARRPTPTADAGKARIDLADIDAVARRQLVGNGRTMLLVEVPAAGKLLAKGQARIGSRKQTVVAGSAKAKSAGAVRLQLRLTGAGRKSLTHGHDLQVRLVLQMPAQRLTKKTGFTLRSGK